LFFGLFKQVNIVVEDKTKGAIFAPFSVSVIFFSGWPKILKQKSLSLSYITDISNIIDSGGNYGSSSLQVGYFPRSVFGLLAAGLLQSIKQTRKEKGLFLRFTFLCR